MSSAFPIPQPQPLRSWAPTTVNRLLRCGLAQAFSQDPGWSWLARPSTHSVLGTAVHSLTEAALRGALCGDSPEVTTRKIATHWDQLVADAWQQLSRAWKPATVPEPAAWPNYQLLATRARRRAAAIAGSLAHADGAVGLPDEPQGIHSPGVEHALWDDAIGLRGKPDLVERRAGRVRVVDLKTGLSQAGPTPDQRRQLLLYAHLVRASDGHLPDECLVVDGSGREHPMPFAAGDVDEAVREASVTVRTYNDAARAGTTMRLARPSSTACRWCAFRPVCRPYFETRQPDWRGAKGDVHGEVVTVENHLHGDAAATLEAKLPPYLSGELVRVGGLSIAPSPDGPPVRCSIVDADLLGGPTTQRLRWNSQLVLLPGRAGPGRETTIKPTPGLRP